MSRVAMFEGIRRRRKGRKNKKHPGRKSLKAYGIHTPKASRSKHGKKLSGEYHWRVRKTRSDAGKGPKTPAQKIFAKAASKTSCPYPKTGTSKQRRSAFNDCVRKKIAQLQRNAGLKPGKGKYRVK